MWKIRDDFGETLSIENTAENALNFIYKYVDNKVRVISDFKQIIEDLLYTFNNNKLSFGVFGMIWADKES